MVSRVDVHPADPIDGTIVGAIGRSCRATVSPTGAVTSWGALAAAERSTLRWFVAADDRWHDPASEPSVRQRRVDGAPVVETRVRVPGGDVVQRVWAVADHGGLVVVEMANDSPLAVAVALTGSRIVTERRPSEVPVRGIDLPADATVMPLGHRATVRVGLSGDGAPSGAALSRLPSAEAVVRGWSTLLARASRLELPDRALVEGIVAARCDLLLDGPVDEGSDPAGHVMDVGELVRLGEDAAAWLPGVVAPAEAVARGESGEVADVLEVVERVARTAGDLRAAADAARIRRALGRAGTRPPRSFADVRRGASAGRFVRQAESRLASGGALLPAGLPTSWTGTDLEVHGIPTGPAGTVSYAIRWHGRRPAVLWEQAGEPVRLHAPVLAPDWSSDHVAGEALWPEPLRPRTVPLGADS